MATFYITEAHLKKRRIVDDGFPLKSEEIIAEVRLKGSGCTGEIPNEWVVDSIVNLELPVYRNRDELISLLQADKEKLSRQLKEIKKAIRQHKAK